MYLKLSRASSVIFGEHNCCVLPFVGSGCLGQTIAERDGSNP
jgi:hypothetical protein